MNKQLYFTPQASEFLIYCYVDSNGIWVLSGFIKKTQKTPQKEIHNAIKIRKEVEG